MAAPATRLTAEHVREESRRRQAARRVREQKTRTLLDFVLATKTDYDVNWHHRAIAAALDDVLAGTLTRLIITVPPRHGKSQLVSRHFPAYVFGKQPDWELIACSYGATLASAMNRDVQAIMDHPDYRALFPGTRLYGRHVVTMQRPLRNSEEFEIVGRKGRYCCAGIGGGITGKGGMLLLIDDPVRDRQAADSPTIRESTYQWYTSVLRTRLAPGGRIVLCQTRWHEDDLAGRLLRDAAADPLVDQWTVLNFEAIKT